MSRKSCFFSLLLLLAGGMSTLSAGESVEGYWKIIDDETGRARSIIALYQHQGMLFGRIVVTFDEKERVKNTIYAPVERAVALPDRPFFAGLDIVWNLKKDAKKDRWDNGKILDPKKGKVYSSELHWDPVKKHLVVRGKIGPFGRNQFWVPAKPADFPEGFDMPDCKTWVPKIPRT
jgi:uncharacterized protein (DUF2147 family)